MSAAALIALVALLAIAIPLLLLFRLEPVRLPPPVTPADARPAPRDSPTSNAADPGGPTSTADRGPVAATQPASHPEPAASGRDRRPDGPIVEHRRVQGDAPVPAIRPGDPRPQPPAAPLDRSAEARRLRVEQFGGSRNTEHSVELGLNWLARHQDADGTWDRTAFDRHCPPGDRCPGPARSRLEESLTPGITGVCTLAFLGAGYTDRDNDHAPVVARAVTALLAMQQPDGGFSADPRMAGYNDSLATFALAEFHEMTRDARIAPFLRRAVARLASSQQEYGGWDYLPDVSTGRNDTSISAWAVQALQACAAGGIDVPPETFIRAALHFRRASDESGRVWYSDSGEGFGVDERTLRPMYRYGPAMTAAGMTSEVLLGWRTDSPLRRKQHAQLFAQLPSAAMARGRDPLQLHSYYYWYYGTIAMFQNGGESWQRWNASLRDAILPLQDRERLGEEPKSHTHGSWDPYGAGWGRWGRMGGRVYATAICTLTLEVYYRHTPAYLDDRLSISADDWIRWLARADERDRRIAVGCLVESRVEMAEPPLVALLADPVEPIALSAGMALVELDSPAGLEVIERLSGTLPESLRISAERARRQAREILALPAVRGAVRLYDAQRRIGTVELPRCYVGMELSVQRGAAEVARMRVIQRFSARNVAVAEVVGEALQPPRPGDTVISQ